MERENIVVLTFAMIALITSLVLWWWHRSNKTDVDLTDLLMENGRLSRLAVTWLGAFVVMTFGFVYLLLTKAMTDAYAFLYAATWAAPIVTKLFTVKPELPGKSSTPESPQ